MAMLSLMQIPCGFPVAIFQHTPWLESVGVTLVVPWDDRSGIASVVVVITSDVYLGK